MNKGRLFGAEWKELFTNKKLLIPVLAVLFIPLLYSGMFLWAFWDPYEKLDELPVAVVNLDKGASYDEHSLAIGEDLVDNLKENEGFMWEFVTKEKAYKGLEKQHYYMVIEIPEDFSKRATTLLDENPISMELKYVPNESYNFLSSQIGSTAVEKIKEEISKELIRTYAEAMFDNIETMASGYEQAAAGTHQLHDGLQELFDGSDSLKKGLEQAAEKSILFSSGVSKAYGGVQSLYIGNQNLSDGLSKLKGGHDELALGSKKALEGMHEINQGLQANETGMNQAYLAQQELTNGSEKLAIAANQLSSGMAELHGGTTHVQQEAERLNAALKQFESAMQPILDQAEGEQKAVLEESLKELSNGSWQLSQGMRVLNEKTGEVKEGSVTYEQKVTEFANGQKRLSQGLSTLVEGADKLSSGSSELVNGQTRLVEGITVFGDKLQEATLGSKKLTQGGEQLLSGMGELESGSKQFQSGTTELFEGSGKLNTGIQQVGEGTQELATKLQEASEKAGEVNADDQTYNMFSNPVKVKAEVVNEVPNYGTGFAPYFLSLGLFVGALLLSIVYPLKESAGIPTSGTSWFFSKVSVLAIVGVLQALMADAVLLVGLGVEVKSIPLFILFSIITSLVFISVIQFLVTTLGDPGRFVAIIMLILQLTTSAGTFPLELIPNALQPFNLLLPMTYSVSGFKAVISSGDFAFMWQNAGILLGFQAVMMLGTWMYFVGKYRKSYRHEVVEG